MPDKPNNMALAADNFSYRVLVTSIPTNAKTMDFTFVVQKTRAVEFLVQPPKGE